MVRKTVKEVSFKNSKAGKDSAGNDMNAALKQAKLPAPQMATSQPGAAHIEMGSPEILFQVEQDVLAGGHPIQNSKAKPLKKAKTQKAPKKSLGEGAAFHTLPDVKVCHFQAVH